MVAAEKLRRLGEVDARKAYRGRAVSTADWAASRLGMTRWEAKRACQEFCVRGSDVLTGGGVRGR
jgi:hypothetical protein